MLEDKIHYHASIGVVRSIRLRDLLRTWARIKGDHTLPRYRDFSLDRMSDEVLDSALHHVEHTSDGVQIRYIHHGKNLQKRWRASFEGKTVREALPAPVAEHTLQRLMLVIEHKMPVLFSANFIDAIGNRVEGEGMYLPFGDDRENIDKIYVSVKLVSLEGAFINTGLLENQTNNLHARNIYIISPETILRAQSPSISPADDLIF